MLGYPPFHVSAHPPCRPWGLGMHRLLPEPALEGVSWVAIEAARREVQMHFTQGQRKNAESVDSPVSSYQPYEDTALHMAAREGNEKAIEVLLDKGADIHSKNEVCPPPAPVPCPAPYGALRWAGGLAHWIRTHTHT